MYFSDSCGRQYKNYKNFKDLCSHKHDFGISNEWVLFATSYWNVSVMALVEQLKRHVAKQSLERSLSNQILDLCENEMMSITFFKIRKESVISVKDFEIEKWYEGGDTVPATRSSHHLVPLSSLRTGPKLSEDESYVDFSPSTYVTFVYNSFWLVGMVNLVDIAPGDVINIDFMHLHGPWKTLN